MCSFTSVTVEPGIRSHISTDMGPDRDCHPPSDKFCYPWIFLRLHEGGIPKRIVSRSWAGLKHTGSPGGSGVIPAAVRQPVRWLKRGSGLDERSRFR